LPEKHFGARLSFQVQPVWSRPLIHRGAAMISIAFFNNKGGVGKTSLVYHTAWMFAELGYRVLAVDLDPQSNLSIMALDEERLEALWPDDAHPETLHGAVEPLFGGTGDIRPAHIEPFSDALGLMVGDLALSRIEDDLSTEWPRCLEGRSARFASPRRSGA
jgi:chromosome partitioning protein